MSKEKILTVAIPTYKRPKFLDVCLASISDSVGSLPVNILVMDDSTDETNDHLREKYPSVKFIKNKKNLGIDKNICACIENAETDYVWLIGEDDLMRKNGIKIVLDALNEHPKIPFIFANYSYITTDQKKIFKSISIKANTGITSFKLFFEDHLWSAGFIGGCVINRPKFLSTKYKEYIGTYYAHVGGLCEASFEKDIYIISEPLVGNRVGDASTFTWSDDSFGVFQGWRDLIYKLKSIFGTNSYQKSYNSHLNAHGYLKYKFLINKKADNLLGADSVKSLISSHVSMAEKLRIRIVYFLLPKFFCNALRLSYSFIRRKSLQDFILH